MRYANLSEIQPSAISCSCDKAGEIWFLGCETYIGQFDPLIFSLYLLNLIFHSRIPRSEDSRCNERYDSYVFRHFSILFTASDDQSMRYSVLVVAFNSIAKILFCAPTARPIRQLLKFHYLTLRRIHFNRSLLERVSPSGPPVHRWIELGPDLQWPAVMCQARRT